VSVGADKRKLQNFRLPIFITYSPLNYIPGILFIFYSIFSWFYRCYFRALLYVFSGLLSVQAFLLWSPVELVYWLVSLSWLFMFHK